MFNQDIYNAIIVALEIREHQLRNLAGMEQALATTERALAEMKALQRGDAVASVWWVDDVYSLVEGDGDEEPSVKITEAEAREVLARAERNHDAEIGINWDVLRYILDDVLSERGEDPNGGDSNDD